MLSVCSALASSSVATPTSALCGTGRDLAEYFLRYVVSGIVLHDNVKAGVAASRVSYSPSQTSLKSPSEFTGHVAGQESQIFKNNLNLLLLV